MKWRRGGEGRGTTGRGGGGGGGGGVVGGYACFVYQAAAANPAAVSIDRLPGPGRPTQQSGPRAAKHAARHNGSHTAKRRTHRPARPARTGSAQCREWNGRRQSEKARPMHTSRTGVERVRERRLC